MLTFKVKSVNNNLVKTRRSNVSFILKHALVGGIVGVVVIAYVVAIGVESEKNILQTQIIADKRK